MENGKITFSLPKNLIKKLRHDAVDKEYDDFNEYLISQLNNATKRSSIEKPPVEEFIELLPKLSKKDLEYTKSLFRNDALLDELIQKIRNDNFDNMLEGESEEVFTEAEVLDEGSDDEDYNPFAGIDFNEKDDSKSKVTILKKTVPNEKLKEDDGYEDFPVEVVDIKDISKKSPIIIPTKKDYESIGFNPVKEQANEIDNQGTELIQAQENAGKEEYVETKSGYKGGRLFSESNSSEVFDRAFSSDPFSKDEGDEFNNQSSRLIEAQLNSKGVYAPPQKGKIINYDPDKANNQRITTGKYAKAQRIKRLTSQQIIDRDANFVKSKLI